MTTRVPPMAALALEFEAACAPSGVIARCLRDGRLVVAPADVDEVCRVLTEYANAEDAEASNIATPPDLRRFARDARDQLTALCARVRRGAA